MGTKAAEEADQEGVGECQCQAELGRMKPGPIGKDKSFFPTRRRDEKGESPVSFLRRHRWPSALDQSERDLPERQPHLCLEKLRWGGL